MAGLNNKKNSNNLGLFAATFAMIFGVTYGAYKAIEGAGSNSELERLRKMVDESFIEGKGEKEITKELLAAASKNMGDKFTQDVADKLKVWVLEEKIKLRREGKI
jgi:hypothetical protein